jgi:uncharacterized iron-regulated protein
LLLGEVHDNPAQHALRAEALRQLVLHGARPAIGFEQFDRSQSVPSIGSNPAGPGALAEQPA